MDEPTLRGCLVAVPVGLVEELSRWTHTIRPEEVARARRHVAERWYDQPVVCTQVAVTLLELSA